MEYFTRPDQARKFILEMGVNVPLSRVKAWIDAGIIPSKMIDGKIVMKKSELRRWVMDGHFRNGDIHYGWNIWAK